jgi:hypothetical protein
MTIMVNAAQVQEVALQWSRPDGSEQVVGLLVDWGTAMEPIVDRPDGPNWMPPPA